MRDSISVTVAIIASVIAWPTAFGIGAEAPWVPVAPGIEYREFHIDGPTNAFVARGDRAKKNWTIDTTIGKGTLRSGCETVPELAVRYDDSVNLAGERYDVKAAMNGDYFSFDTQQSASGQIISGWFVKRFGDYSGGTGFVWSFDGEAFLGGNVRNGSEHQHIVMADKSEMEISEINAERKADSLVLYTPHYADRTYTTNDGVEVLVQVSSPLGVASEPAAARGKIVAVREQAGSTPLAFDHVVLSGHGRAAEKLARDAKAGQEVRFVLGLKDYGNEVVQPARWRNVRASLGGHFYCVAEGKVPKERWEPKGKPGAVKRHPRTAVAFNDSHVFFVVVDGRSEQSVGMTITELGEFCVEHLAARYAIAQDGGGSSTLWLDGKVMNVPSDGKLRPVANGYLMALVEPRQQSKDLSAGSRIHAKADAPLRLGPGTEHAALGQVAAGRAGEVVAHTLNGVFAKGSHWWKCRFDDLEGWLAEEQVGPAKKSP